MTQPNLNLVVHLFIKSVLIYFIFIRRGGDEEQVQERMFKLRLGRHVFLLIAPPLLEKVKVGTMCFWQSLPSFSETEKIMIVWFDFCQNTRTILKKLWAD